MCELLEICVPLCVCVFRSFQFGFYGLMCIVGIVGECCDKCCPRCCDCHKMQKAVSQDDVRQMDTVDANWGEPSSSTKKQSTLTTQPTRTGHLDEPESTTISSIAISSTPLAAGSEPPVVGTTYDMGLGWAETHHYEKQMPSDNTMESAVPVHRTPVTSERVNTVVSNIQPSAPPTHSNIPSAPPPSYEESQKEDEG